MSQNVCSICLTNEPWNTAVLNGHLNCLVNAGNIERWNAFTYTLAIQGGNLACLKYLHENKCPLPPEEFLFDDAVRTGNLANLEYLRQVAPNGWNEKLPTAAVVYGNLACLKYLHENSCPWNK